MLVYDLPPFFNSLKILGTASKKFIHEYSRLSSLSTPIDRCIRAPRTRENHAGQRSARRRNRNVDVVESLERGLRPSDSYDITFPGILVSIFAFFGWFFFRNSFIRSFTRCCSRVCENFENNDLEFPTYRIRFAFNRVSDVVCIGWHCRSGSVAHFPYLSFAFRSDPFSGRNREGKRNCRSVGICFRCRKH